MKIEPKETSREQLIDHLNTWMCKAMLWERLWQIKDDPDATQERETLWMELQDGER